MSGDNFLLQIFVVLAFVIQLALIARFALRGWMFPVAMRFGLFVYGLCAPAPLSASRSTSSSKVAGG